MQEKYFSCLCFVKCRLSIILSIWIGFICVCDFEKRKDECKYLFLLCEKNPIVCINLSRYVFFKNFSKANNSNYFCKYVFLQPNQA